MVKQGKRTNMRWKPIVISKVTVIFCSNGFPAVSKAQLDSKRDTVCPRPIRQDLFQYWVVESLLKDLEYALKLHRVWV
jgi:hypothetical protein